MRVEIVPGGGAINRRLVWGANILAAAPLSEKLETRDPVFYD